MSKESVFGTVQWKVLIDKVPHTAKQPLLQQLIDLKRLLDNYPTAGMCLLGDNVDYNLVIPDVVQSLAVLREKISEVDATLGSASDMLVGYYNYIQPEPEPEDEVEAVHELKVPEGELAEDEATADVA